MVPKVEEQIHELSSLLAQATTPETTKYMPEIVIAKSQQLVPDAEAIVAAMTQITQHKKATKSQFNKLFADLKPVHNSMKVNKAKIKELLREAQEDLNSSIGGA